MLIDSLLRVGIALHGTSRGDMLTSTLRNGWQLPPGISYSTKEYSEG